MPRIESPSSINLYKQCPRRYYYRYIEKLPTSGNRYTLIGNICHETLEHFFAEADLKDLQNDNFHLYFNFLANQLKEKFFEKQKEEFIAFGHNPQEIAQFKKDIDMMISNWTKSFNDRIAQQLEMGRSITQSFNYLKPQTEVLLHSSKHGVRGFIDAIFKRDSGDIIVDYKTSKKVEMSESYKLQLAIYALLFREMHGRLPKKVGIDFLKHSQMVFIDVDEDLIKKAEFECELIKINTQTNNIADYPKKTSPLCKWSTGQCDFYDACFSRKTLGEF